MNIKNILSVYILYLLPVVLMSHFLCAQERETARSPSQNEQERLDVAYDTLKKAFYDANYEKIIESAPAVIKQSDEIGKKNISIQVRTLLGNAFLQIDDKEKASQIFNETLLEAEKFKDTTTILKSYINLGNLSIVSEPIKAIAYFENGLALNEIHTENEFSNFISFVFHNNLSELYVGTKDTKKAQYHSDKALTFLKAGAMQGRDQEGLATIYFVKGSILLLEKKYDDAISAIKNSLTIGEGKIDKNYLLGNYKNLIEAYDRTNQLEELNAVRKQYDSLKDEIYESDKIKQQQIARTKYNLDKYEQELRASQLENELADQKASRNQLLFIVSIFIALALLLFTGVLLYGRKKKSILLKSLKVKNKQYLAAKERSEKLSQSKTAFLSTISHELRTPLYGIIGLTSVFLKDPKLIEQKDDLQSLKFSADYLLALVNDVLRLNKLSSNKGKEIQQLHFDVRATVAGIVQTFEFINKKNNNQITVSIDDQTPEVIVGDKTKVSQVLMNLVSNASKFTEDGSIEVSIKPTVIEKEKCALHFTVSDTGSGITEEQQKTIFDEFAQVHTLNDRGGSGLGLPIVNKILKILGSKLQFKSVYGAGTKFCFILDFEIGNTYLNNAKENSSDEEILKNKSVLIVDDNKINQIVSQKVLDILHIKHHTASNGLEALEKVKEHTFDVILMDINMPIMNGKDTSKEIRNLNINTPIIALTATDYEDVENELYIYGINDNIVKPYHTDTLVTLLLKYIS